jgi:hypothetical protein
MVILYFYCVTGHFVSVALIRTRIFIFSRAGYEFFFNLIFYGFHLIKSGGAMHITSECVPGLFYSIS